MPAPRAPDPACRGAGARGVAGGRAGRPRDDRLPGRRDARAGRQRRAAPTSARMVLGRRAAGAAGRGCDDRQPRRAVDAGRAAAVAHAEMAPFPRRSGRGRHPARGAGARGLPREQPRSRLRRGGPCRDAADPGRGPDPGGRRRAGPGRGSRARHPRPALAAPRPRWRDRCARALCSGGEPGRHPPDRGAPGFTRARAAGRGSRGAAGAWRGTQRPDAALGTELPAHALRRHAPIRPGRPRSGLRRHPRPFGPSAARRGGDAAGCRHLRRGQCPRRLLAGADRAATPRLRLPAGHRAGARAAAAPGAGGDPALERILSALRGASARLGTSVRETAAGLEVPLSPPGG